MILNLVSEPFGDSGVGRERTCTTLADSSYLTSTSSFEESAHRHTNRLAKRDGLYLFFFQESIMKSEISQNS